MFLTFNFARTQLITACGYISTYLSLNAEQNKCDILHPGRNNNNTKRSSIPPSLPAVTPCLESVAALRAGQGSPATRPAPQVTMERTAGSSVTVTTEPTATASPAPACAQRATWWVQFICTSFEVHLKSLCSSWRACNPRGIPHAPWKSSFWLPDF